jgi:hypothetical protein
MQTIKNLHYCSFCSSTNDRALGDWDLRIDELLEWSLGPSTQVLIIRRLPKRPMAHSTPEQLHPDNDCMAMQTSCN